MLELVNDSLIYNDDVNCLLYGIYRKGQTSNEVSLEKIEVKPNPSSDHISIKVSCMENEIFSADITNAVGQSVLNKKLKCNQVNIINISELQQGAYTIVVKTKNEIQNFKLIVVR